MKKRSIVLYVFVVLFAASSLGLYLNRQYVKDYFIVHITDLSAEATDIGGHLALTSRGDFLYQASQTEMQKAKEFNTSCSGLEKQAVILGCYSAQRIYVYDITDKQLKGVREVTAAHELLHAAYERLSSSERQKTDSLLQAQLRNTKDKDVLNTIKLYKGADQATLLNEMHSIFGTELKDLSPELEAYYKQYFTDRTRIVTYAKTYQTVFKTLEDQANELKKQLGERQQTKEAYETQLNSMVANLKAQQAQMEQLRLSDTAAYNSRVPAYNQLVANYNSNAAAYKELINEMNAIISKLNSNITQLNNLTQKLDSHYKTY